MLSHYVKQDVDTEAYLICLFCRHKELGQAEECPKYKTSGGVTIGCTFADVPLPVFTDINFCLNGSSPEGPLKPTFASLQIQNHGKYISCSSFDSPLAQLWPRSATSVIPPCMLSQLLILFSCVLDAFMQWSVQPQKNCICKQVLTSLNYTGNIQMERFLATV